MIDLIGIAAGLFIILAFYTEEPRRLREYAITSNLLFISYAVLMQLWPILLLHGVLLPLNLARLRSLEERRQVWDQMSDQERERFLGAYRGRGPMTRDGY